MIGSPERVKIQRSSVQKLGRFTAVFGCLCQKLSKQSIFAKKWPNFRLKWPKFRQIRIFQAYRVWFHQRRPQEQLPYHKLRRFIAAFGSYRSRTLKTVNLGQKMALNGPNFAISEFSQHKEYDFLKEDHKNNFHTKN